MSESTCSEQEVRTSVSQTGSEAMESITFMQPRRRKPTAEDGWVIIYGRRIFSEQCNRGFYVALYHIPSFACKPAQTM